MCSRSLISSMAAPDFPYCAILPYCHINVPRFEGRLLVKPRRGSGMRNVMSSSDISALRYRVAASPIAAWLDGNL